MKTRREKILKQPLQYEGGIPQYSLGGILASTAIGAGTGAVGGGGVLSVPGAILGGIAGLGTGLWEHFKEKKEEKAEARANLALSQQSANSALSAGGSINNYMNPWLAGKGGIVHGGMPVKLRNKEMLLGPDGTTVNSEKIGATTPEHTNNGIATLEDGTVIVSPENSSAAKSIARRQKPEIERINKVLNDPKSTPLQRKTAERRLAALKQEYMPLIVADAQKRVASGGTPMGGDNIPQAALGQVVGNFLKNNKTQLINTATQLAPVLYNVGQGMRPVQQMNPAAFQNPLAYNALQTMENRQPDIEPALRASEAGIAAAEQNLRSTATGRGQYMSGRIALANADLANKSNIYSQGSQERNRYLGELSQMQAGLGQSMAETNLIINDLNARNEAARRNYSAAAAGQLSQYSQVQQQMKNQENRDRMLMNQFRSWQEALTGSLPNKVSTASVGNLRMPTIGMNTNTGLAPVPRYGGVPRASLNPITDNPLDMNALAPFGGNVPSPRIRYRDSRYGY